jgi:uncharacterized protein (DUF58 family)
MRVDRDMLRKVSALKLATPRVADGPLQGDRRSPRRGRGVEFADYRAYTPGDDLRLVDWNIYGRLEMLLVRLFHEDLNMSVQIMLDASASMGFGAPRKADHGAQLTACLALVSLLNQDSVSVRCLGGQGPRIIAQGQNTGAFGQVIRLLEQVEPAEQHEPWRLINAMRQRKPSDRAFLISDMLQEPEAIEKTLRALKGASHAPVLLHVLSEEELSPNLEDAQRLIDSETGEELLIAGGARAKKEYDEALEEWLELLKGRCRRMGIHYMPVFTDQVVSDVLARMMRQAGITQGASGVS